MRRYIDFTPYFFNDGPDDNYNKGNTNFVRIYEIFKRFVPQALDILKQNNTKDADSAIINLNKSERLIKSRDTYAGDYLQSASDVINRLVRNNSDTMSPSDTQVLKKSSRMIEALASNIFNTR